MTLGFTFTAAPSFMQVGRYRDRHFLRDGDPAWPVHAAVLNNRGITWLYLRQDDAALRDIDAILATPDIVMEQKMAARLDRAGWLAPAEPARAVADLELVLAAARNFPGVTRRARLLLDRVCAGT